MLGIGLNNLFVLFTYFIAGQMVFAVTGSRLARLAPWAVFSIHHVRVALAFAGFSRTLGLLPCLALTLPHAWLELTGYCLGCAAGSKISMGRRPILLVAASAAVIVAAAAIEAYITPFPLEFWLK